MNDTHKTEVKVFPDYCSTGLWLNGANADPDELGISEGLQLALKYWHEIWEFGISLYTDSDIESPALYNQYTERWKTDGKKLCELMSQENDKFVFVDKL